MYIGTNVLVYERWLVKSPASPTLSPFHRLTLLMHVSQKGFVGISVQCHVITNVLPVFFLGFINDFIHTIHPCIKLMQLHLSFHSCQHLLRLDLKW